LKESRSTEELYTEFLARQSEVTKRFENLSINDAEKDEMLKIALSLSLSSVAERLIAEKIISLFYPEEPNTEKEEKKTEKKSEKEKDKKSEKKAKEESEKEKKKAKEEEKKSEKKAEKKSEKDIFALPYRTPRSAAARKSATSKRYFAISPKNKFLRFIVI
jgi:chromatin remodeling complex protein RSC6